MTLIQKRTPIFLVYDVTKRFKNKKMLIMYFLSKIKYRLLSGIKEKLSDINKSDHIPISKNSYNLVNRQI